MLTIPRLDQWHIKRSPGPARPQVEWSGCPEQSNAIGRVVRVEWTLLQEGSTVLWQLKLLILIKQLSSGLSCLLRMSVGDWVDEGVKVEGREVWILGLDVDNIGSVVPGQVNMVGKIVVEVGEGNLVLCPDGLSDDDLVDVIELIPVILLTNQSSALVKMGQLEFSIIGN